MTLKTNTSQTITFAQGSSSSGNTLNSGDSVRVLNDVRYRERAIVRGFGEQWGAMLILGASELPFHAIGLGFGGRIALDSLSAKRQRN